MPRLETIAPRAPHLLLLITLAAALTVGSPSPRASAQEIGFPSLNGRVVDEAEVLAPETEAALIDLLASHESANGIEVVVVTLSGLRGIDIADYARRLAHLWSIGESGEQDGVLIILAPRERAVRIEVSAGVASRLPQSLARRLIEREILPFASMGDFDQAMLNGTRAVLSALTGAYIPAPPAPEGITDSVLARLVVLAIALFYLAMLAYTTVSARRRRIRRRAAGRGSGPLSTHAVLTRGDGNRRPNAGSETGVDGGPDAGGGSDPGSGPEAEAGSAGGSGPGSGGGASGGW